MANWLDKYEQGGMVLKKKTKDNYGKRENPNDVKASVGPDFVGLGYNTKGRDYSPAWGGQFADGGKVYKSKPMAQSSDIKSASNTFNADDFSNYSTIINKYPNMSNDTSYMYTRNTPTGTEQFFHNTNQGKPVSQLQRGNEFVNLSPEQINTYKQKVLTGTGGFAMGGALPGAVGFTYARTAGSAPANGKYTKKTKASAQLGIGLMPHLFSSAASVAASIPTMDDVTKKATDVLKNSPKLRSAINSGLSYVANTDWGKEKLKNFANNIDPHGYVSVINSPAERIYSAAVLNKKEDLRKEMDNRLATGKAEPYDSLRVDLINQYAGLPQKYNTLKPSQYTPTMGDKNQKYFNSSILDKRVLDDINVISRDNKVKPVFKTKQDLENFVANYLSDKKQDPEYPDDQTKLIPDKGKGNNYVSFLSGLGSMTYGIGEDEKGHYLSYYDNWDLNPYAGLFSLGNGSYESSGDKLARSIIGNEKENTVTKHIGNPTNVYNRIYFDKKTGKPKMKKGGVIKDDRGQWAYPGEVTEIGSNNITMQGVDYPVLGVSDTGDTQMMQPNQDYKFDGEKVTEYPMMQEGGWLDKYPEPMRQDATRVAPPVLKLTEREKLENAAKYDQGQKKALVNAKEELAERKKNKATKGDLNTPGSWHTEDKARLSNILPASWAPPGGAVDVFDEYINPATYVGVLTDALGESIAARDPKGIAASLALSAGAGALGLDPLGSAIKTAKGIGKRFFKPSFTSGKEALDFLNTKVDDIGEENVVKIISKKTGKTRKQIEDEFAQAVGNADNPRDPEYIIRQANILNGGYNLPKFPKSLKELDEKAGKLVSKPNNISFDKTEIINRANEILEKGVGVKKKNISVKLESTPNNVIEVKVNDNNPYFPVLDYNKSGYMNLEPNFHSIDTKSTTFTEWLQGKKPETRFVKNWGDFETEPAFTKIGDFPYDNRPDLKGTGVGAEAAEAMKQALEEKGIKLQSSTNHTQEGRLRYLTEFLNDRKKAINTEGNPGWIDVVNNIKESLKGKKVSKEEVQELMNLNPKIDPKSIRFQYKEGGWLNKYK